MSDIEVLDTSAPSSISSPSLDQFVVPSDLFEIDDLQKRLKLRDDWEFSNPKRELTSGHLAVYNPKLLSPYPDDPADTTYFQDAWATVDGWDNWVAGYGVLSVSGGKLINTYDTNNTQGFRRNISGVANKTLRIKIEASTTRTMNLWYYTTSYIALLSETIGPTPRVFDVFVPASATGFIAIQSPGGSSGATIAIDWVYVGTGAYLPGTLRDLTGNGLDCTVFGSTPSGDALIRDGVNDYEVTVNPIEMPDRFWYHETINTSADTATKAFVSTFTIDTADGHFFIFRRDTTQNYKDLMLGWANDSANNNRTSIATDYLDGKDNIDVTIDVCIDFVSMQAHVWRDGIFFSTTDLPTLKKPSSQRLYFGRVPIGLYHKGTFRNRRLLNIIPTDAQVRWLYENPKSISPLLLDFDNTDQWPQTGFVSGRGWWQKHADGTLEQWFIRSYSGVAVNTAYGSSFVSAGVVGQPWPILFEAISLAYWTIQHTPTGSSVCILSGNNGPTVTSTPNHFLMTPVSSASTSGVAICYGRGRWRA